MAYVNGSARGDTGPAQTTHPRLPPGTQYDAEGRAVEMSLVTLAGGRTDMLFTTRLERW
ncbi:hypothetical protein [Streptomyces sp. NPDC016845]|uniref:hypothetical protein n=1 Tax=Streptomyces sp. NPDC016845 TaxID=3364972 RepID=UPI003791D921